MMTSRKLVKTILIVLILCVSSSVLYAIYGLWNEKSLAAQKIIRLSFDDLSSPDDKTFDMNVLHADYPLIMILFNTQCDHCQEEAEQLKSAKALLNQVDIVMVSSAPYEAIIQFKTDFQLDWENLHFATIDEENVFSRFGTSLMPSIFIYASNGSLITSFKGKTKVETILKTIADEKI